jgi:transcriptional regulator with XRE-family HTH domain
MAGAIIISNGMATKMLFMFPLNRGFNGWQYKPIVIFIQPIGLHLFKPVSHTWHMPRPQSEKQAFAKRLKLALKNSRKKIETAAELALQFNLRHAKEPVTQQAAQKWLSGQACPTPDKIETIAEWLKVSAQWLRYGIAEDRPEVVTARKTQKGKATAPLHPTEAELNLLARIRGLSGHRRYLIYEIVEQFALEQEIWRE